MQASVRGFGINEMHSRPARAVSASAFLRFSDITPPGSSIRSLVEFDVGGARNAFQEAEKCSDEICRVRDVAVAGEPTGSERHEG